MNVVSTSKTDSPMSANSGKPAVVFLRRLLLWALIILVYVLLDRSMVAFQMWSSVSAWYPPTGLSLALMAGLGPQYAVLVFVAAVLSSFLNYHISMLAWSASVGSLSIAGGYGLAASFLRRGVRINLGLARLRDVVWFVVVALIAAVGVACAGVACLTADGSIPPDNFLNAAFNFWVGDSIALMTVTPFLLVSVLPGLRRYLGVPQPEDLRKGAGSGARGNLRNKKRGWLEIAGQTASIVLVVWAVFGWGRGQSLQPSYLLFIPLIWIATRHGLRGATLGVLGLNTAAVLSLEHYGIEAGRLAQWQPLMLVVSLTGLCLGALTSERRAAELELEERTAYLNALVEDNPLATVALDATGLARMCNPAFERLFQYAPEEIIGRSVDDLIISPGLREEATLLTRALEAVTVAKLLPFWNAYPWTLF
jgi:integral membrane sensor domain MASE1